MGWRRGGGGVAGEGGGGSVVSIVGMLGWRGEMIACMIGVVSV